MNRAERMAAMRVKVEQAKDDTPTSQSFIWVVPVFVCLAVMFSKDIPIKQEPKPILCVAGYCI